MLMVDKTISKNRIVFMNQTNTLFFISSSGNCFESRLQRQVSLPESCRLKPGLKTIFIVSGRRLRHEGSSGIPQTNYNERIEMTLRRFKRQVLRECIM
jgi:hypothetical protein